MEPFHQRMNYRTDNIKHELQVYINCQISSRVLLTGLPATTIRSQRKFLKRWHWLFLLRVRTNHHYGKKFLRRGTLLRESIFISCARAYNDLRGYWMEYFCSLVPYFNFWKSHWWREIQDYNFVSSNSKYTVNGQKWKERIWRKYLVIPLRRNGTFKQRNFV